MLSSCVDAQSCNDSQGCQGDGSDRVKERDGLWCEKYQAMRPECRARQQQQQCRESTGGPVERAEPRLLREASGRRSALLKLDIDWIKGPRLGLLGLTVPIHRRRGTTRCAAPRVTVRISRSPGRVDAKAVRT